MDSGSTTPLAAVRRENKARVDVRSTCGHDAQACYQQAGAAATEYPDECLHSVSMHP